MFLCADDTMLVQSHRYFNELYLNKFEMKILPKFSSECTLPKYYHT